MQIFCVALTVSAIVQESRLKRKHPFCLVPGDTGVLQLSTTEAGRRYLILNRKGVFWEMYIYIYKFLFAYNPRLGHGFIIHVTCYFHPRPGTKGWNHAHSSPHNHGSVENGALEDDFSLQGGHFPLNHDCGRKSKPLMLQSLLQVVLGA